MGFLDLLIALVCAVLIQHAQEKGRPAGALEAELRDESSAGIARTLAGWATPGAVRRFFTSLRSPARSAMSARTALPRSAPTWRRWGKTSRTCTSSSRSSILRRRSSKGYETVTISTDDGRTVTGCSARTVPTPSCSATPGRTASRSRSPRRGSRSERTAAPRSCRRAW